MSGGFLGMLRVVSSPQNDDSKTLINVRDDPKLLDDGGEIPKYQGEGWRFGSHPWNLPLYLTENLSDGQLPLVLWRWPVGILYQKGNIYIYIY